METTVNILDLPFLVLDEIFKHLDEWDKWSLAGAHDYLGKAFAYHIKDAYATVTLHYNSDRFLERILPLCGSKILHIDLEDNFNNFIILDQLINDCFDNLQSINITVDDQEVEYIKRYLLHGKKFQTLRVRINASSSNFSKLVNSFLKLGNLKELHIKDADCRIGERFTYLEDLQLDFGPFQFRLNIYDVLLPLKNLRKVKIVGLGQMPQLPTTEMFGALESFCICNSIICQIDLPVCPKLKQIGFWSNFCPSSILFKWIFDHATTLEKVSIAVEGLNKDNIFEIIKKCKFLRDFHLKMEIESFISKEFVGKVNDILKSNGYTSEKPIVLVL
ncbi:hypothetical protein KR067_013231, partial [Drosophila pandora]